MITKIAKLTLLLTIGTTGMTSLSAEGGQQIPQPPLSNIYSNGFSSITVNYVYTADQERELVQNSQKKPSVFGNGFSKTTINIIRAKDEDELKALVQKLNTPNRTSQFIAGFAAGAAVAATGVAGAFALKKFLENRPANSTK